MALELNISHTLPLSEQGVMPDQLWVSLTLPKRLTIIWTHFTWEWNINALENLFTGQWHTPPSQADWPHSLTTRNLCSTREVSALVGMGTALRVFISVVSYPIQILTTI